MTSFLDISMAGASTSMEAAAGWYALQLKDQEKRPGGDICRDIADAVLHRVWCVLAFKVATHCPICPRTAVQWQSWTLEVHFYVPPCAWASARRTLQVAQWIVVESLSVRALACQRDPLEKTPQARGCTSPGARPCGSDARAWTPGRESTGVLVSMYQHPHSP